MPCKMEEIWQAPLIISVDEYETLREAYEEKQIWMIVEKIRKPFNANQKPMYGISYYLHSYQKVKWSNIKLLRINQKLKSELAQVK